MGPLESVILTLCQPYSNSFSSNFSLANEHLSKISELVRLTYFAFISDQGPIIVYSSNTWGPSSGLLRLFANKKSTYSLFGVYGESKSTFEFSFQLFLIISGYNYLFHLQAVRVNISWLSCCEKALPSW